jgi:hypothetical protein
LLHIAVKKRNELNNLREFGDLTENISRLFSKITLIHYDIIRPLDEDEAGVGT